MSERYLDELKRSTDDPSNLGVSNYHHLEPPSCQMGDEMNIKHCVFDVKHAAFGVFWCENTAIICVGSFCKRISLSWVENLEHVACLFNWQNQDECHENAVSAHQSHHESPKYRVRPFNHCVRELCHRKSKERHKCKEKRPPHTFKNIRVLWVMEIAFGGLCQFFCTIISTVI